MSIGFPFACHPTPPGGQGQAQPQWAMDGVVLLGPGAVTTLDTYAHLWPDADESTRAAVGAVIEGRTVASPEEPDDECEASAAD